MFTLNKSNPACFVYQPKHGGHLDGIYYGYPIIFWRTLDYVSCSELGPGPPQTYVTIVLNEYCQNGL